MEKDDLSTHISHAFNDDLTRIRSLILDMGHMVEQQIGAAVKALAAGDVRLAHQVEVEDYQVDHLELAIDNECSQLIVRRQPTAMDLRYVLAVIKITSDLERIGDHAKNVSEQVFYFVEGMDVRHVTPVPAPA
ncbi:MAG TPA: PhoU domain-containing protein [Gammaproteobacteria bacterium]|jgi:phosphate transport system protein